MIDEMDYALTYYTCILEEVKGDVNTDICIHLSFENFDQLVKQYPKIRYYFTLQNEVKQRVNFQDYFESYSS